MQKHGLNVICLLEKWITFLIRYLLEIVTCSFAAFQVARMFLFFIFFIHMYLHFDEVSCPCLVNSVIDYK